LAVQTVFALPALRLNQTKPNHYLCISQPP
jgi:hypothetical protein